MTRTVCKLKIIAFCLVAILFHSLPAQGEESADFGKQVLPILESHCVECHGANLQESNYRLDLRSSALGTADFGDPPIVPGNAVESPLYQVVAGSHADEITMPPEGEGEPLSAEEVAILKRWIDAGATWPDEFAGNAETKLTTDHWSFQPVVEVRPPVQYSMHAKTPIDLFVLQKLRTNNLDFSELADRVTWIRRVYLDLHGLPPTAAQVNRFVNDPFPDAYAKVIDEVLASPHYGERWSRHWLDVARFGESTGFEVNRDRENAYYFRDYVIGALNSDKSYRQFIIDQLAGDVDGDEIGTGFLVGGPYDMVKSPDINLTLMQRQDELADFVNTTGTAFLGMTIGCARCHNHKFDPIPQRDYYALQAVFAGVQHGERELTRIASRNTVDQIAKMTAHLKQLEARFGQLREIAASIESGDEQSKKLPAVNARSNVDRFPPIRAKKIRFTILATNSSEPCIDELEVLSKDARNVALSADGAVATASGSLEGYPIHKLEHVNDGKAGNNHSWISNTSGSGWIQIEFAEPAEIEEVRWGRDRNGGFNDRIATSYRIDVANDADQWVEVASSDQREPFTPNSADAFIRKLPKDQADEVRSLFASIQEAKNQLTAIKKNVPKAYVGTFKNPEPIRRLHRGDPLAPREEVDPDALSVISSMELSGDTSESGRRLALANWIANPDNPLTARVIVNRVWHYHFGTGIVSTPSDLGVNGTQPSHPELLDWMASQFMDNGWSLKWLHRQILSSHIYQQSSRPRQDGLDKDAASRLLWRFPPRRLEAEAIRDCVLLVSGALNPDAGGPGFLLFRIDHENVHHYFPLKEFGPEQFRRMIYMMKIRQEQDDVFGVFDCPDGAQVIPDRSRSTTPLQALNLLNSRFMLGQADLFAERTQAVAGDDPVRQIEFIFETAFSRAPSDAERQAALELADEYGIAAVCRAIFNANEFLFLN